MTVAKKKIKTPTARERLQPSILRETQLELMGEDVDLNRLYLKLQGQAQGLNIVEAVTDVDIQRTIEGASTVTVTVEDRDGLLLNSGKLSSRNDIEIDGLYFRLVSVSKAGVELTLTFEDREITLLRKYSRPIKQSLKTARSRVTRAEFVLRMIREVKETKIRYVIPELHKQQPIDGASKQPPTLHNQKNKGYGVPKGSNITVKGSKASAEQLANINAILSAGVPRPRKVLVMAIMCATQESSIINLGQPTPGHYNFLSAHDPTRNPVGCFQQIKHWGWPATRDVAKDATAFYDHLGPVVAANPNMAYGDAIDKVQGAGTPGAYQQWRTEAERTVTAWGLTDSTSASANATWAANVGSATYEFYRGLPPSSKIRKQKYGGKWGPENSWDCIQRLAQEVQWRAFFVSGVFYFIAEDDLYKTQPIAMIDEDSPGIESIDGDYDEGKKTATLTVKCRMGRWAAPPGSVIGIQNMGPWNGRWLVNDVERSAFDSAGTITLKKPLPRLPEPSGSNLQSNTPDKATWHLAPPPNKGEQDGRTQWKVASALIQPVPDGFNPKIVQGVHSTLGLAGNHYSYFTGTWPFSDAADFGGDFMAPVLAPESGQIVYWSGHDPMLGPVEGVGGPLGWSIYLKGDSGTFYFITHLQTREQSAGIGMRVVGGQKIGTIANYAQYGNINHTHVGMNPQGKDKRPDIHDLMNALIAKGPGV